MMNIDIIIILLLILAILIIFFKYYNRNDIFDPFNVFLLVYTLYVISGIIHLTESNNITYSGVSISEKSKYLGEISVLIGLLGFVTGYKVIKIKNKSIIPDELSYNIFYKSLVILTILYLIIFYKEIGEFITNIEAYGNIQGEKRIEWEYNVYSGIERLKISVILYLLIMTVLFKIIVDKSKTMMLIYCIIIIVLSIISMRSGKRGTIIQVILPFILMYNYKIKKINKIVLIFISIIIYVYVSLIQHARYTSDINIIMSKYYEIINENRDLLLPQKVGEYVNPSQTIFVLIEGIENNRLKYKYFKNIIDNIKIIIPRFLYKNRGLSPPEELHASLLPDYYYSGKGTGYLIINDGYWAFGFIGVFLYMYIWGGMIKIFYEKSKGGDNRLFTFYCVTYPQLILFSVRTGIGGTLKMFIISAAIILLPIFISTFLAKLIKNKI